MEGDAWPVHSKIKFKYDQQFIQPYTKSKYRLNDEEVKTLQDWVLSSNSNDLGKVPFETNEQFCRIDSSMN